MRISDDPIIIIEGYIEKETERAYLFLPEDADEAMWVPKSQVRDFHYNRETKVASLTISEWIAKQKGLA